MSPEPDLSTDPPAGPRPRALMRWLPLLALLMLFALPRMLGPRPGERPLPYSTFLAYLDSSRVSRVVVGQSELRGALKPPGVFGDTLFTTTRVEHPTLLADLRAHGVMVEGARGGAGLAVLFAWLFPVLAFLLFWSWMGRRAGGGAAGVLGMSRSRARVYVEQDTRVSFSDVAGVDEAKAELQELVAFLRDPESFGRLGAHVPKGVLLVGPPGTGKTLLARAVAGEAGVPFFSITGSEFVEMFVGLGAARVRDLFAQAKSRRPCIIFIDELDALGRARGRGLASASNEEQEQTLNQLLAELDGFTPEGGVVVLAATNRPEILDPALLRAGRFDRQVMVDRPDRSGRRRILTVHAAHIRLSAEADLDQVASITPGFTGADLANLVNEAALAATRRGAGAVAAEDFTVAVERIVAGLARRSRVLSPRERSITAHHEMGHAIVALATPGADPVHKVSIIPRTMGALGFTMQRPAEDRCIATRAELEGRMAVLLGGRAAELEVFGELSTGAADDLVRATELARDMVSRYGMDATVGHVVFGTSPLQDGGVLLAPESRMYSEQTAREIETAMRAIVQVALERAQAVLRRNRAALDRGARMLIERESLSRDELPPVTPLDTVPPVRARRRVGAR